jgi:AraC family L-rhamnose operon regulatory protein RhaS
MRKLNTMTFEMYRRPDPLVLPELVSVGLYVTSDSQIGGPRRDGPDGLEIGYLETGSVEWWDGEQLDEAPPGSILIDRPGDWQGGSGAIVHPCKRYWLRFNFPSRGPLSGLLESTTLSLRHAFYGMQRRHFPGRQELRDLFCELLDQQRDPDDFAEDFSRAIFHQILIAVFRDYQMREQQTYSASVRQALDMFHAHLARELTIEAVAREVGLSTGYLHEVFLRETGFTPANYHLRLRIDAAKRILIENSGPVTEAAMDLGFSSSQYFSTAFKKVVGLTPMQYRQLRSSAKCVPRAGGERELGSQLGHTHVLDR